jgi:hypothetical protein
MVEKLPPPTWAAILMALLGILLVGLFLVVIILLGGNWVRKLGKHRRRPSVPSDVAPLRPRPGRDISPSTTNHLPFQQPSQENPNDNETQISD